MTIKPPHIENASRDRITVEDVKASFNNKVRPQIFVRLVARPIAVYLTPSFYNAGISANKMTTFRLLSNLMALGVLASGYKELILFFVTCTYLNLILDCLDGNLARMSKEVTYWGKFFDGFTDRLLTLLTPCAAAFGYWVNSSDEYLLIAGFLVTLTAMYAELIKSRTSHHYEWMIRETGGLTDADRLARSSWKKIEGYTGSIVYNITFLSPLLLILPNGLLYFIWVLFPVQGLGALIQGIALFRQGWLIMRRSRISIHSREAGDLKS